MKRKLINWVLLFITIAFVLQVIRSFDHMGQRRKIITDSEKKLVDLETEQDQLTRKFAGVQTQQYMEKEARDKLNLGKDGEIVVLLPSISPIPYITPTVTPLQSSWRQWVGVFF